MNKNVLKITAGLLILAASCKKDNKNEKLPVNAYAVGNSNELISFNVSRPSDTTVKAITGLQTGETIHAIDMRPANNQLYALGSTSRIYQINTTTGVATAVGTIPFSPLLNGASFGFDFNPMVDRIRVISNTRQNLRINPETGALAAQDTDINPGSPTVSAAAYNNNTSSATTTSLYVIDAGTDKLYTFTGSPNGGVLTEVGALGVNVENNNGFDISGTDNKAYALLTSGGITKLYSINLTTGAATAAGDFPVAAKGLALALGL